MPGADTESAERCAAVPGVAEPVIPRQRNAIGRFFTETRMVQRRVAIWLASAAAATLSAARTDIRAQAVVSGVVRDSVYGRPFAGATIELVPAQAPWMQGYTARSDSSGRFSIADVAAGKYLFGFLHPRLDSLGMDQVTRTLDVKPAQTRVTADLALPSARTLAAMLCSTRRDNVGVLLGRVYDARDGRAISVGTVLVKWGELSVGDSGVRNDAAQRSATVHDDGRFIACDVPVDAPLLVQAVAGNIADPAWVAPRTTSGLIEMQFSYDVPLLHRDLFVGPRERDVRGVLADSAAGATLRGSARLVGHIIADNGKPVAGARVVVREAGAEFVTDTSGAFRLTGLPLGTHTVEVIALGYSPMRTAVDLRPDADAVALFHPSRRVQTLDEVTVRSTGRDLTGFERRRRRVTGVFLTAADIERKGANSVGEALMGVPGLRYIGTDPLTGRPTVGGRSGCAPLFFLDGIRQKGGLADIDSFVSIGDVGGIEVYNNPSEAPPQFAGGPDANVAGVGVGGTLGAVPTGVSSRAASRAGDGLNAAAPRTVVGACATVVTWTRSRVP
jgi:Carboxypeptidase regulatory-like domain/TonB-dependent Receptor Plug Domain